MEKKNMYLVVVAVIIVIIAAIGAALVLSNPSGTQQNNANILLLKKTSDSPAYSPVDEAAVYNNSYPLARYLYLYTDGVPYTNSSVHTWLAFVLNSTTGQTLVSNAGFYPLQTADLIAMKAQLNNTNKTGPTGNFKEGGSTTLEQVSNLWAADFLNDTGIQVTISLGGSGTGISNFINHVVDVAQSSRAMTAGERASAAANGINVTEWKVAVDGITIITNHDNPVTTLTMSHSRASSTAPIPTGSRLAATMCPSPYSAVIAHQGPTRPSSPWCWSTRITTLHPCSRPTRMP